MPTFQSDFRPSVRGLGIKVRRSVLSTGACTIASRRGLSHSLTPDVLGFQSMIPTQRLVDAEKLAEPCELPVRLVDQTIEE